MSLHFAKSPITNRIYCGGVLKDGVTWASTGADDETVLDGMEPARL